MKTMDAFYLPGLDLGPDTEWRFLEYADLRLRWPVLNRPRIEALCKSLRENQRSYLVTSEVSRIVEAIAAAARAMQNDFARIATLLSTVTGYSRPVVEETLRHMLHDWGADALNETLRSELGDPRVLDQPLPHPVVAGRLTAAYGFPLGFHVFSGNVPGIAVTSVIRSLLVKSAAIGKTASGEPLLPVLFAQTLAAVSPGLAGCLALTYWPGGSDGLDAAASGCADCVVVYGGDQAVANIVREVTPGRRLIVHGSRVSFALAGPAVSSGAAAELARAVAAYDQQGCVSPQLVYVVGDRKAALAFAADVADGLDELARTSPRGRLSSAEAVAIRNARTEAEFAPGMEVFGSDSSGYSVILEEEPSFRLSCLNRVLYVKAIPTVDALGPLLPVREHLQSAGIAGFDEKQTAELVRQLGHAGVSRVTSFAELPWPTMSWHHDGSGPLRELIYWQDVEL